jgi:hypothetical protein
VRDSVSRAQGNGTRATGLFSFSTRRFESFTGACRVGHVDLALIRFGFPFLRAMATRPLSIIPNNDQTCHLTTERMETPRQAQIGELLVSFGEHDLGQSLANPAT